MTNFSDNFALRGRNTFGLDATAPYWAEFRTAGELRDIILACRERSLPWYVLGGGSNIILTGNFPGVVIHPAADGITQPEPDLVRAEAATVWDDLVAFTVERGLGGLENLSLIPGHAGAAPVQNIGAYGVEAKDTIETVEYFDTETLETLRIKGSECAFGYRESIFKGPLKGRAIVTAVEFRLTPDAEGEYTYNIGYGDLHDRVMELGGASLENIRRAVIAIREAKLPDPAVTGNAGSFFKNPVIPAAQAEELRRQHPEMPGYPCNGGAEVKVPAAWLIDRAGWKGFRSGTVGVHPRQALVLINLGGATAQEILTLARRIICDVERKFGVTLTMEVNVL